MPLSYRRALERRIRASAQTRQKTRPMDAKLHVALLRRYSEYLTQMFTEVSTHLTTLEQTLSEGHALPSADIGGLLDHVASLQSRLCTEGELFCQRLHLFLEEAKTIPDPTPKLRQKNSADLLLVRKSAVVVR